MDKIETDPSVHETRSSWRRGPDYFGFLAAVFIVGCMITGLYTMVIYSIGWLNNWQKFICPIAGQ